MADVNKKKKPKGNLQGEAQKPSLRKNTTMADVNKKPKGNLQGEAQKPSLRKNTTMFDVNKKPKGYLQGEAQKPLLRKLLFVWDIENCQVPKGISASSVVKQIRQRFLKTYVEYRFVVACDVTKLQELIRVELSDAQVEMLHVESTCKNAADTVLKLQLQNFGCNYSCMGAAVLLISSDINFAPEIADLRNKRKVHVILLHNKCRVNPALTEHSDEHHDFNEIIKDLPPRPKTQTHPKEQPKRDEFVSIRSVPKFKACDKDKAKKELERVIDSCGGKVSSLENDGAALLAFHDDTAAERATIRMHNEYVCGSQIKANNFSSDTFKVDSSDPELSEDEDDTVKLVASKSVEATASKSKKQAFMPKACQMCKSRPIATINLPCQHTTVCQECTTKEVSCYFCHGSVKGTKPLPDNC